MQPTALAAALLAATAAAPQPAQTELPAAIAALSEPQLRSLLLAAALRDEATTGQAVRRAAAGLRGGGGGGGGPPTVSGISRDRVPLDGDASPSPLGRRVTVVGTGFLPGSTGRAVCNVSSASLLEGFVVGFLPNRQAPATVINSTHLSCALPPVETAGPARLQVSVDGGATFSAANESGCLFEYFALGSLAVGRRPYTTEAE